MKLITMTEEEFYKIQDNITNSNFYQTTSWAKIKEKTNWVPYYIGIKDNNKIIASSLLLSKKLFLNKKMFYSPRGLLLNYNNESVLKFFTIKLKKFIKDKNGILLKIDPLIIYKNRDRQGKIQTNFSNDKVINNLKNNSYHHKGFSIGYTEEAQFRWSYYLSLKGKTKEDLFKDMDQRSRRCIRKYKKYPLINKEVTSDNIKEFKSIMEHTAIRQKHYDRSLEYYQNLKEYFTDRIKLIIIYLDKKKFLEEFKNDKLYGLIKNEKSDLIPISAGVFIEDKNKMNYVYGGTYSYYMPLMAQYKLQMDMIYYSLEKKLDIYDFGGITGDFKNDGVYEFKRGFGGYVVEYIGEFDLIINKFYYHLYNLTYKIYRNTKKIIATIRK